MCTNGKNMHFSTVNSRINDYPNAIYNSLLGNAMIYKHLVVLENHNIIMRKDFKTIKGKVKIIGGGGGGIAPAEAGYIGKGMLTAAVFGEMFSAPSVEEILVAIRELAWESESDILLLVKNYVGDKLNFGLALDKASSEGIKVKMIVLGDDASEPIILKQGRRALAGSVLVYKIAGEMAELDKTLDEIIKECRDNILTDLATISLAQPNCTKSFCESLSSYVNPDEMVLGMGVYGQYGKTKVKCYGVVDAVSHAVDQLYSFFKKNFELRESNVVVLVNNHGSTSKIEETIIAKEVTQQLNKLGVKISLFYSGTFMSSFNSNGFSITILKVTSPNTIKYLEAPTSAPAWPKPQLLEFEDGKLTVSSSLHNVTSPLSKNKGISNAKAPEVCLPEKGIFALKQTAIFAAEALISCEKQLNIIDSEVGDGDTGTVLRQGASALKKALINDEMNVAVPSKFLYDLSDICCKSMGGISGALYSVFFSSAAKVFENAKDLTAEVCCAAFKAAVKAIKHYGKAELGDRTVLDVLSPAADSFEAAIHNGKNLSEAMYLAAATCEFKAEETKLLLPPWQHQMNISKPLLYPDAGAHAATIWLRAMSEAFEEETPTIGPGIFVWKFLTKEECEDLVKDNLSHNYSLSYIEQKLGGDQTLLAVLLNETFSYARNQYGNDSRRISALVGTVYYTHLYFTASLWRNPSDVYYYFKESILRQSVESPPISAEIFEPEEAKAALLFFFETYIRNLPLVRLLHLPHYKLQLRLKENSEFIEKI